MTEPKPRVTMLVRNAFTHDSRVEKEARSLTRAGYPVVVVAEGRPHLPDREQRDGYAVVRIHRGRARLPGHRLRQYRSRLVDALEATRPDILHAHDSDALDPVARVAARRGIPFVYDAHELWLGQENRGRARLYYALFRVWYWWVQRRLVRRAAAAVTVSQPIAEELERTYGRPFGLVPNYPDVAEDVVRRNVRDLLDEPIPDGAPIILYLGNIQVGRGLEELVTALRDVPGAYIVFLGAKETPAELLALAERLGVRDRLRVLPPVPSDEVVGYAMSGTLGVALATPISRNNRYSLSNKLFQYMAAGIPVVANNFPHIRGIVEGSKAGLCVDPDSPAEIAGAIRRLLDDPVEAEAMGANGAHAVRDRYNWDRAADVLLAAYARLTPA